MLEWAVLAPVSADVVVSLLPYADAVAIQSTLRLSLDMFGAVWSRDGLQLRPFTNCKWYINGIISMGTVYSMGLSFHEWADLLTYNWYFRP